MPEALQSLIDKLQGEVVEEAQSKADAIVAEAKAEAERRLAAADTEARRMRENAERDATLARERGERALEQAGRDLLLAVRRGVEDLVMRLVHDSLEHTLTPDTLREMLIAMARAYAERHGADRRMSILLGPDDLESLARYYADEFRQELAQGVEIRLGRDIDKGFRVTITGDHVEHDFTLAAHRRPVRDARPELARLLAGESTAEERP